MRLRLVVQRHRLPPMPVVWNVGGHRLPYTSAGSSVTISQLLEQVNEVIPLESENWGLEDYSVEVRGFECLHFSDVNDVLKEDDEVSIRPLQTSDLRVRKLSGRLQIASDGRHLVDGVAFGRPFLRRGCRPAIQIPPRKRIRLLDDGEEASESVQNLDDRQVVVRSDTNDHEDQSSDGDDADDEDFQCEDQEAEELAAEAGLLCEDYQITGKDVIRPDTGTIGKTDGCNRADRRSTRTGAIKRATRGLGLQGSNLPQFLDDNGAANPGVYSNPLLDHYGENDYLHGRKLIKPEKRERIKDVLDARKRRKTAASSIQAKLSNRKRRESSASAKSVRFQEATSQTPATVLEAEDSEESDENFEPRDSESDKENAEPADGPNETEESTSIDSDSSSSISSKSKASSSEASSSESSSASSTSASDSSGSSSSSSSSGSGAEGVGTKQKRANRVSGATIAEGTSTSSAQTLQASTNITGMEQISVTPGKGKKATKLRNDRRRSNKKLAYLKSIGVLAVNAGLRDLYAYQEDRHTEKPSSPAGDTGNPGTSKGKASVDLEAKRQALLKSIALGGIDIKVNMQDPPSEQTVEAQPTSPNQPNPSTIPPKMVKGQFLESRSMLEASRPHISVALSPSAEDSSSKVSEALTQETTSAPSQRRAKLDLASSKRLLFGSLGLKTPKTKQDETDTRARLMQGIRPIKPGVDEASPAANPESTIDFDVGDDSWKDKITLKAVECCYEGIELSTPPFPFVQRWDPQQQRGYRGSLGKEYTHSKKRKRKQHQYYQDEAPLDENLFAVGEQPEQHPSISALSGEQFPSDNLGKVLAGESYQEAIDDQIMRDATGPSASASASCIVVEPNEDLPALPEDIFSYPELKRGMAVPGAVISFKQLDMSEETSWQPQISEYRTATIIQLQEDGTLHMTLALRDQRQNKHRYDRETGERIYSKFEMPESDDEGNDNSAMLEISFDDLIEPRLVVPLAVEQPQEHNQEAPANVMQGVQNDANAPTDATSEEPIPTHTHDKTPQDMQESGYEDLQPEVDEDSRREISMLIKEAGWGATDPVSSVNPPAEGGAMQLTTSSSPRFNGFSPSIPDDMSSKVILDVAEMEDEFPRSRPSSVVGGEPANAVNEHGLDSTSQPQYPVLNLGEEDVLENSSPRRRSPIANIGGGHYENPEEPHFPAQSSPRRQLSFDNQEVSEHNISTELQDVVDTRTASEELSSESSSQHHTSGNSPKHLFSFDGADSDSEFPALEKVISTTKTSFDTTISEDDDDVLPLPSRLSKQRAKIKDSQRAPFPNLPGDFSPFPSTMPTNLPSTRLKARKVSSYSQPNLTLDLDDNIVSDDEVEDLPALPMNTAKRVQKPINGAIRPDAQIVDLTMSSDPAAPSGSDYEDGMPSGTGWIRKKVVARKGGGKKGRNTPLAKSSGTSGISPYQIMEDMLEALEQRIH